jgi:arabinogalactan endo-1,4-beta-galactosidase
LKLFTNLKYMKNNGVDVPEGLRIADISQFVVNVASNCNILEALHISGINTVNIWFWNNLWRSSKNQMFGGNIC